LPEKLSKKIESVILSTKNGKNGTLNLAFNYGGRQEIITAVNRAISLGEEITVDSVSRHLYTSEFPDPELIIRTSGEQRLSNFLLWQSAYSEFYFTKALWPDFDEVEFDKAIADFNNRKRRFGGINEK
jgi:undecaprenyl diphosphate synthase